MEENGSHLVPHVGVGRGHVHFQPQSGLAGAKFALLHVLEQLQRLFDRSNNQLYEKFYLWSNSQSIEPVSPRTARIARCVGICKLGSCDLSGDFNVCLRLVTHICLVTLDELHGELVQYLKVVRSVRDFHRLPSQPVNILTFEMSISRV